MLTWIGAEDPEIFERGDPSPTFGMDIIMMMIMMTMTYLLNIKF
jgi:hypothetical protein